MSGVVVLLSRSIKLALLSLLFTSLPVVSVNAQSKEFNNLLPDQIGDFRRQGAIRRSELFSASEASQNQSVRRLSDGSLAASAALASYRSDNDTEFLVEVVRFRNDTEAYSFLTVLAHELRESSPSLVVRPDVIGTAGFISSPSVTFFKGPVIMRVTAAQQAATEEIELFARALAMELDAGDADIPVLIKHLPDWENAHPIVHNVTLEGLKLTIPNSPILDSIIFDASTEAVTGRYGNTQMLIVEFTTPQIAGDNDRRITARLEELRTTGQEIPTAYSRVGNYSVFVFDAPNEQVAQDLIGQVKYEQVVQWLGDDPYWYQRAERRYVETTAGVLIVVVKAAVLALFVCLAAGGIFGALLFSHRRRKRPREVFSDAGGMLRLNLDEMTAQPDSSRLIGRRNSG